MLVIVSLQASSCSHSLRVTHLFFMIFEICYHDYYTPNTFIVGATVEVYSDDAKNFKGVFFQYDLMKQAFSSLS